MPSQAVARQPGGIHARSQDIVPQARVSLRAQVKNVLDRHLVGQIRDRGVQRPYERSGAGVITTRVALTFPATRLTDERLHHSCCFKRRLTMSVRLGGKSSVECYPSTHPITLSPALSSTRVLERRIGPDCQLSPNPPQALRLKVSDITNPALPQRLSKLGRLEKLGRGIVGPQQ